MEDFREVKIQRFQKFKKSDKSGLENNKRYSKEVITGTRCFSFNINKCHKYQQYERKTYLLVEEIQESRFLNSNFY